MRISTSISAPVSREVSPSSSPLAENHEVQTSSRRYISVPEIRAPWRASSTEEVQSHGSPRGSMDLEGPGWLVPLLGEGSRRGSLIHGIYSVKSSLKPLSSSLSSIRGENWCSALTKSIPGPMLSNLLSFGATAAVVEAGAKAIIRNWFPELTKEVADQLSALLAAGCAGVVYPMTNAVGARLKSFIGGQNFIPNDLLSRTQKRLLMAAVNTAGTAVFPVPYSAWGAMVSKGMIPEGLDKIGWAIKGPLGAAMASLLTHVLEDFLKNRGLYTEGGDLPPGALKEIMENTQELQTNAILALGSRAAVTLAGVKVLDLPRALQDAVLVWVYFAPYIYPRGVEEGIPDLVQ